MGLFTKLAEPGSWIFDTKTGVLTINGSLGFLPDPFKHLKGKVRSVVALPGAKIYDGSYLFYGMIKLVSADLKHMNVSKCDNMEMMFASCPLLTTVDVSTWDMREVRRLDKAFHKCRSLQSLNLTGWHISPDARTKGMFDGIPQTARILADDPTVLALLPESQRRAAQKLAAQKPAARKAVLSAAEDADDTWTPERTDAFSFEGNEDGSFFL